MAKCKKRLKVNWAAIAALVIVCVLVAGICCAGFASRDDSGAWFRNWNLSTWHWSDASEEEPPKRDKGLIALTSDGEKMYAGRSYALPASMTLLNPQAKTADSTYAEGEFVIQARLSNPFIKGSYDWSVEFLDTKIVCPDGSTNSWTTDKTASDFVSVTALEDDSTSAKLKFIAPFGKQIKLSAQLKGTGKVGECVIDCLAESIYSGISSDFSDFDETNNFSAIFEYGLGTVKCEYYAEALNVVMQVDFKAAFLSYLTFEPQIQEISKTFSIKCWFEDGYLNFQTSFTYLDFLPEFDGYSDNKKQAIYYAWYHAAESVSDCAQYDYSISAYYNGQKITKADYGSPYGMLSLSGYTHGATVAPDVNFNTDVTFG